MANFKSTVTKPNAVAPTATPSKSPGAEIQGVICYPNLVDKDPQSDKYAALLLVTDEDSKQALSEMVADASEQTFRTAELPAGSHNPLRDANEKNAAGEYAFKHPIFRQGGMVVRAKTGFQPECVWGPNRTTIEPSEINGGDDVVVELSAYGYNNQSKGCGISLGRVWLIGKGAQKVERGTGSGANIKRIDRSRLRFTSEATTEAA